MDSNATATALDLRNALTATFRNFSIDASELAQEMGINSRYSRELLATLVRLGLVTDTDQNGELNWQCVKTYDDHDLAEVLADLAAALNTEKEPTVDTKTRRTGEATKTNPAGLPGCFCGCGEATNRDRNYRPGHDARHAGIVGRAIAQMTDQAEKDAALMALPTMALRTKAARVAANAGAKKARKSRAKAAPAAQEAAKVPAFVLPVIGKLKVGRWTYDAVQNQDGSVVYKMKSGGDKIATADQATKFVAN